ncbi:MAG: radical SAM protein, partial [Clostridia bacterium]|nr:radical SAM protein [Clostridia bacterium]
AILLEKNCDVFLRDYQTEGAEFEDVANDINNFSPDVIFISITNNTVGSDVEFVKKVKNIKPDCKVIFKGAVFFNIKPEHLKELDLSQIDFLVGEEVETVVGPLADYLMGNCEISDVAGVWYKSNGEFKHTGFDTEHLTDLDSVPFPARQLMNNSLYIRPDTGEPMATIVTARGCPSSCTYCFAPIIFGKCVRFRSVDNVFAEIEECVNKYSIFNFFFQADTFTINKEWTIRLCDKIIASPLHGKIHFTCNARTDTVSSELLQKLKEAGCFTIAVGYESGSDKTLKLIKKGTTVEKNRNCAKMIKESSLPVYGFFIIGFPWETKKDFKTTLKHALELDSDYIELHVALPHYSTPFYDQCVEYGTIAEDAWNHDLNVPNTTGTQTVPLKKLLAYKRYFLFRYYARPSYILRLLKNRVKSKTTLKSYFKYGFKLLKHIIFG